MAWIKRNVVRRSLVAESVPRHDNLPAMSLVTLTCCGEKSEPPLEGDFTCPNCRTQFTEIHIGELRELEQVYVPVVTLQGAKEMLPMLSQEELLQEGKSFGANEHPVIGLNFPIVGIRDFANRKNLPITPRLLKGGVLWTEQTKN
jgi:hypothetical protein